MNGSKRLLHRPCTCHSPRASKTPRTLFAHIPHDQICNLANVRIVGFGSLFRLSALHNGDSDTLTITSGVLFVPSTLDCVLANRVIARCAVTDATRLIGTRAQGLRPRLLGIIKLARRRFKHFICPNRRMKILAGRVRGLANLKSVPIVTMTKRSATSTMTTIPTLGHGFTCLDDNA